MVAALLWLCAAALGAVQVQLRAEPPALSVGQVGTVRVMVVSGGARDPQLTSRRPTLPTGRGLVAEYSGQGSTFQNVNGRITRIQQFEFRLTAVEPGTWAVGPAEVSLDNKSTAHSDPVQITVRERSTTDGGPEGAFAIDVGFDRTDLWEGQIAVFHARFESRVVGAQIRWRIPEFDGLRAPQSGNADQSRYTVDDPSGVLTIQADHVPLVAVATGARDQGVVTAEVGLPIGLPDVFGLSKKRIEQWASERLTVTIKPLPPPPVNFSGLVGDFEVRSSVDATKKNEVGVGQSVPWVLALTGSGALEGFALPPYAAPGASVYENDSHVTGRIDGDAYRASAAFRRVIVPTEPGELVLPSIELVTFSPSKGKYVTHKVPMPTLTVVGSGGAASLEVYGQQRDPLAGEAAPSAELRPPYTWGRPTAPSLAPVLPPLLGVAAAPGLLTLLGSGFAWVLRRRRAQAEAVAPDGARAVLARLPKDPEQRLAALDQALRRIESQGAQIDQIRALRMRLGRARFGDGGPDPELEVDLRRLARELEQ